MQIYVLSFLHRQAGVRNGMFFGKAKQLCPTLQSVPYDFEAYKEVALIMYEILSRYRKQLLCFIRTNFVHFIWFICITYLIIYSIQLYP